MWAAQKRVQGSALEGKSSTRFVSIDIMKVGAAVVVFFFHCNVHLGVRFGGLTAFVSQGAIMMDLFFMLSGFVSQLVLKSRPCDTGIKLGNFYFKQFVKIYPLYLLICLYFLVVDGGSVTQKALRFPLELFLLQSSISPGLFPYGHNGGTWFLSCLMMAYLFAPIFSSLLSVRKNHFFFLSTDYFLCALLPVVTTVYSLPNVYSNPFLRVLQFIGGMVLADLTEQFPANTADTAGGITILSLVGLVCTVNAPQSSRLWQFAGGGTYVTWGIVTFPLFSALIYGLVGLENLCKFPNFIVTISKTERYCYSIYMAQFFVFTLTSKMIAKFPDLFATGSDTKALLLASVLCVTIALVLYHLIIVPCQKLLMGKIQGKRKDHCSC